MWACFHGGWWLFILTPALLSLVSYSCFGKEPSVLAVIIIIIIIIII
jgi:uncharacterized membrane protein